MGKDGAAPVVGGDVEEASRRLGSHVPEVARGGGAWRREAGRWRWLLPAQGGRCPVGPVLGQKAGGPKWAIAMAGQKKLKITYGLQRSTGRIEMGRERKNIIIFAIF
jgi:hypothetical protein